MSYFSTASTPFLRSVAVTALIGAAMFISPLSAARADESAHAHRHQAAEQKAETVEQRIAGLHAALQITPAEETNWNAVAQTMRDNAGKMEKLSAEKTETPPDSMTAIDNLKTYEKFAHAHFEGLKDLISSFETLYTAMPDAQKKIADHVFQSFGREHGPSHA